MDGSVPAGSSKLLETVNIDSQMIRITSHGKMKPWIAFALNVIEVCSLCSLLDIR